MGLELSAGNTFTFYTSDGTSALNSVASNGNLSANRWYFIAGVMNETDLALYINGVINATIPRNTTLNNAPTSYLLCRNAQWAGGADYFLGAIDELAVWERPLAEDEIRDIYTRGVSNITIRFRGCGDEECTGDGWTRAVQPLQRSRPCTKQIFPI